MKRIVIVGAGAAGIAAAGTLREEGFAGSITVIGDEAWAPYARPAVSKQILSGDFSPEQARLRPESWYTDHDIDVLPGTRVSEVYPDRKVVALSGGRMLPYDSLLLATGGTPRRLRGADVRETPGILSVRNIDDALALRAQAAEYGEVTIVGGGFIGLEVAARLVTNGIRTVVLESEPHPLLRVLGPQLGSWFAELHRRHGVDLRTGIALAETTGRSGDWRIRTADGAEWTTPVILAGIGMSPSVELGRRAGCEVTDGIVVDEFCRTSIPGIFAAGDCAVYPDPFSGAPTRTEHWQHAQRQGACAARNMLGAMRPYDELPWFWSEQYDVNLQMVGYWAGTLAASEATIVRRGSIRTGSFAQFALVNGAVRGAVAANRARDIRGARALIAQRAAVHSSRLADETVALTAAVLT